MVKFPLIVDLTIHEDLPIIDERFLPFLSIISWMSNSQNLDFTIHIRKQQNLPRMKEQRDGNFVTSMPKYLEWTVGPPIHKIFEPLNGKNRQKQPNRRWG